MRVLYLGIIKCFIRALCSHIKRPPFIAKICFATKHANAEPAASGHIKSILVEEEKKMFPTPRSARLLFCVVHSICYCTFYC